jgi:GNAT superfamily N-acetyltransferase
VDDSGVTSKIVPRLVVCSVADLTSADKTAIVALCSEAFGQDFGELFDLVPDDSVHALAYVEGQLAGHACWSTRWLQPAGWEPLRTAYVDAVATRPSLQGRGVGSSVMRRMAEETRDYDLGGLSTSRAPFYRRLGWEQWRGPVAIRHESGLVYTPGETVLILRTSHTPRLDLDGLLTAEPRGGQPW